VLYDIYIIAEDYGEIFLHRAKYDFICKKCQKEITIDADDIENIINKCKEENKKNRALGIKYNIPISTLNILQYWGSGKVYNGIYVTLAIDYYKNKGIDLNQINDFQR
jgi:hypothetical protein